MMLNWKGFFGKGGKVEEEQKWHELQSWGAWNQNLDLLISQL